MHLRHLLFLTLFALTVVTSSCTRTVVRTGPPPPRTEVVAVAPSPRHVWVPGHYAYRGRGYRWIPGHYRVAPRRYRTWVPGYWRQAPRGHVWVEGHWQ